MTLHLKTKTCCRSLELVAIVYITSYDTNAVISRIYTHSLQYRSHSVPRLWINSVIIIMSLASLSTVYMLTVICRLPISPLSSLSLQLISVAFCKHQVTQQLVRHHGSVSPDEQNSVAEYDAKLLKTFSVFCQDQDQDQDFYLETKTKTCLSSRPRPCSRGPHHCWKVIILHLTN